MGSCHSKRGRDAVPYIAIQIQGEGYPARSEGGTDASVDHNKTNASFYRFYRLGKKEWFK